MIFRIFAAVIGTYILGSIPSAYLFVKWWRGQDVRRAGSGNVGTLNALRVTGSKGIALLVLCLDVLKGVLIFLVARGIGGDQGLVLGAGILAGVLGHMFPVWLRFHGGRGLAVSAGILLFLTPKLVVLWLLLWGVGYLLFRTVIFASIGALLVILLFIWWPAAGVCPTGDAALLTLLTLMLIAKHLPRFYDALSGRKLKSMI